MKDISEKNGIIKAKDLELQMKDMMLKSKELEIQILLLKTEIKQDRDLKAKADARKQHQRASPDKNRLVPASLAQYILAQELCDIRAEHAVSGLMRRNFYL